MKLLNGDEVIERTSGIRYNSLGQSTFMVTAEYTDKGTVRKTKTHEYIYDGTGRVNKEKISTYDSEGDRKSVV